MNKRVMVSASAVALVALAAGGAGLIARSSGTHAPKTIMVQDSGGSAPQAARATADTASGLMAPNSNLSFVLSGDLPALVGDRPAWHLAANPTADLGKIAELAKTLGVAGDVNTVEGGWQVGDPHGTGPNLFVNKVPGLPWNYSNYTDGKVAYACAASGGIAPDESTTSAPPPPPCPEPAPPVGIPTKDEALAKATGLLTALGIDAGSLTVTANASEWSADVQAVPNLDGIATPSLTTSFGFGGEGKLQYAGGFLLAPEKADSYPRIATTKAFELLKAGKGYGGWFAYGGPMSARDAVGVATAQPATTMAAPSDNAFGSGGVASCTTYDPAIGATPPNGPVCMCAAVAPPPGVPATTMPCAPVPCPLAASDTTAVVDPKATPDTVPCGGPITCAGVVVTTIPDTAPVDASKAALMPVCAEPGPLPVEPTTPPAPITITITGVRETLVPLTGADGSMWLVPGYEFTSADNGAWPVLAIDESFVEQVAPAQPIPENATTAIGGVADTPTVTAAVLTTTTSG